MYDGTAHHALVTHKFTGKERDSESGLDMFGARYYGSSLGRFMTPDWAAKPTAVPYAYFGDPQSLNLYSYVGNNPLKRADPDGHCPADNPNCGKVNVTVDQPTPEMKVNVAGPNGATSGPGVQTTIKITDNGKSVTNTDVTEHPVQKDNITGASHSVSPVTANTKDTGQIKDNVIAPMEHNSANTPEHKAELTSDSLSMPGYSKTTSQTLTFTTPSGAACQATYSEVLQNVDPSTGKSNPVNSNGVNFTFTRTDPVVSPQPQNQ
jgi:RHS repeat-associated protein